MTKADTAKKLEEAVALIKDGGGTFAMVQGISQDDLEAIYGVAHTFYGQQKYDKAEKLFAYLCLYNHLDKRFWKGLAASRQMNKNYKKAAEAYAYMALIDVEDPEPSFHAAFCFLEMKDKDTARKSLDAAIHQSMGKKKYASLHKQAVQMLEHLNQ